MTITYAQFLNDYILPTLLPVLVALAGWAVAYAQKWFEAHSKLANKQMDDIIRSTILTAVQNGANFAMNLAKSRAASETVTLNNVPVAEGVQYVIKHVPDALAHFGLTGTDVQDMVIAHLPKA